jgi:hypothetical protein
MKDSWDEEKKINLREVRSHDVVTYILNSLLDFIPTYCQDKAIDTIYKLLDDAGAEIITDQTRKEAGLPPRGPDGWTAEELIELERRRMELLMQPISTIYTKEK